VGSGFAISLESPGLNISGLSRAMREKSTGARLPVSALTACAWKGDEERFFAAGFDGYVSKPLEVKKLVAEMKRVLEFKGTADSGGA